MRLAWTDKLIVEEGSKIPWWGRVWRRDFRCQKSYVLPVPVCWAARFLWDVWCWSFRFRPNAWEQLLLESARRARRSGYAHGYDAGKLAGKAELMRELEHRLAEAPFMAGSQPNSGGCKQEQIMMREGD